MITVKDRNRGNRAALLKLNKASSDADDRYEEDFLGYYRSKPHQYFLVHALLETKWLVNSEGRHTPLINEGTKLEDNTFVKGFPLYPADAIFVKRTTMENLPFFLPALELKK